LQDAISDVARQPCPLRQTWRYFWRQKYFWRDCKGSSGARST
jgi:hypothetical protein